MRDSSLGRSDYDSFQYILIALLAGTRANTSAEEWISFGWSIVEVGFWTIFLLSMFREIKQ